jgi:hypothetical protein
MSEELARIEVGLDHPAIFREARERAERDATFGSFEFHLVTVAAQHGAVLRVRAAPSSGGMERVAEAAPSGNLFDLPTFAAAVRGKLERDGLSYREAAPYVPTSSSTLHRVATGKGEPDVETFLRIQRWLGQAEQPAALSDWRGGKEE